MRLTDDDASITCAAAITIFHVATLPAGIDGRLPLTLLARRG